MKIEPIKKINETSQNKHSTYYHSRGYNSKEQEIVKVKRKVKKPEIELNRESEINSEKYYQNSQTLYHIESTKIKNTRIYKKLNSKDSEDIIPEHKDKTEIQIQKIMKAKAEPTKKQEMEEFKESLKPESKSDLEVAFEKFERTLVMKEAEKLKDKRNKYRGYDRDK